MTKRGGYNSRLKMLGGNDEKYSLLHYQYTQRLLTNRMNIIKFSLNILYDDLIIVELLQIYTN